jgi:transcriptional regulator with XRE-family HTH domain
MPRTKTIARPTPEDADLAKRIGTRIRDARLRASLTQQQLAGERYTKAYISALETGIARPSMVALNYLSERLNLAPSHFLDVQAPEWTRLQADLQLAAGEWQAAADGYDALLEGAADSQARAQMLRGRAEAMARLGRGREAVSAASEAVRLFSNAGSDGDVALTRYWLAYGLYLSDNEVDARSLLRALLEQVRAGLHVEPDFEVRLLVALASVESRAGEHAQSLAYLEEARGLADDLDDRRRATFLVGLAISYRETGDIEAAIRVGTQAMALYRAAGAMLESATIENDLALAYLASGNNERAHSLAAAAERQAVENDDQRLLSAILDTQAQIALDAGERDAALALATRASQLGRISGNELAELAGLLTAARTQVAAADLAAAEATYRDAAVLARAGQSPARLRQVLREWAGLRAQLGDHRGAYELTNEALAAGS